MKAYQLKIAIKGSHPPIWRRCIVPANLTFSALTDVLNIVMGWDGYHLSSFEFDRLKIRIEEKSDDFGFDDYQDLDAAQTPISSFMESEEWFTYIYDFGDYWQHRVTIEKILPDYEFDYPMVIKYKGDTPYEDCGGIYGYYNLLNILQNPEDPEYEEMRDWAGDPEDQHYDIEEVNEELKNLCLSMDPNLLMEFEEASLDEWRTLYETATRIGNMKPWEQFYDLDLFALEENEAITFISILGHNEECYGLSLYEGYEGLKDFMLLLNFAEMNLSEQYAAFNQNSLTCYWGNRDELTKEQWNTVKSLGYKYRGKNQWLYFISRKAGFFPENLNRAEVCRMTEYLIHLEEALIYYREHKHSVDFDNGNMFCFFYDDEDEHWKGEARPLPFTSFFIPALELNDSAPIKEITSLPLQNYRLDVSIDYPGVGFHDENFDRIVSAKFCIIADTDSGLVYDMEIIPPDEFEGESLLNYVASIIFKQGRPKELRVSNDLVKTYLQDFCTKGKIKLKKVKRLPAVEKILEGVSNRL